MSYSIQFLVRQSKNLKHKLSWACDKIKDLRNQIQDLELRLHDTIQSNQLYDEELYYTNLVIEGVREQQEGNFDYGCHTTRKAWEEYIRYTQKASKKTTFLADGTNLEPSGCSDPQKEKPELDHVFWWQGIWTDDDLEFEKRQQQAAGKFGNRRIVQLIVTTEDRNQRIAELKQGLEEAREAIEYLQVADDTVELVAACGDRHDAATWNNNTVHDLAAIDKLLQDEGEKP